MLTNLARKLSCVAACMAALVAAPAQAQASQPVVVNEYDVFVDLPTAFAFIKLPNGWKFIGKLDAQQLRHLPQGTLTSLLPTDAEATKLAVGGERRDVKRGRQAL